MAATPLDLIDNQRSELKAAFRAFGSVSEQLAGAYEALRAQVAQLHIELGEAHAGKEHLAARLSALIEGLPGGVLVLDARGDIKESNPTALALLGEPLLGQSFSAVLARAAVRSAGIGEHTELRSGRFVNVSRRELAEGGEVVLLADVTEAHLMNVFLTRQQRLVTLGELAAGLAHQIRTPLAAALLYASQMTLPGRAPEDLSRCSEKTVASLKQLDRLVNDMLAFAHGGAARETVSVARIARASRAMAASGAAHGCTPDHPHRGAGIDGARERAFPGIRSPESRHQCAASERRRPASRAARPPHPRRAAPRSW